MSSENLTLLTVLHADHEFRGDLAEFSREISAVPGTFGTRVVANSSEFRANHDCIELKGEFAKRVPKHLVCSTPQLTKMGDTL